MLKLLYRLLELFIASNIMVIKFMHSIQDFDNASKDVQTLYHDGKKLVLLEKFELS